MAIVGVELSEGYSAVLLSLDNMTEITRWNQTNPISDCNFRPNNNEVTWNDDISIVIRSTTSPFGFVNVLETGGQIIQYQEIPLQDEIMVLSTQGSARSLESWNSNTLQINWRTSIGFKTNQFTLSPDSEQITFSTNTPIIPVFTTEDFVIDRGTGPDLDNDGIADNKDSDDDGDDRLQWMWAGWELFRRHPSHMNTTPDKSNLKNMSIFKILFFFVSFGVREVYRNDREG